MSDQKHIQKSDAREYTSSKHKIRHWAGDLFAKIFQGRMASPNMRERLEVTLETLPAGPTAQIQAWGFGNIDSFLPSAVETKKAASPVVARAERAGSVLAQHCIAEGEIQVGGFFLFFLSLFSHRPVARP